MEITMADDATSTETAAAETSGDSTQKATATEATSTEKTTATETAVEGEEALGDAGKKALDAMKAERKAAREAAAAEKARADELQAKLDGKEAEHKVEQERRATEQAALEKANQRILRSEIKAAAKGVLADPADAYKFLDLDSFEVSEDGEVDDAAIADALAKLVEKKPYLAVQDGKRFQGDGDGGTRKESTASQLTRSDLEGMSAGEIEKARKEGRLNDLLGIKT